MFKQRLTAINDRLEGYRAGRFAKRFVHEAKRDRLSGLAAEVAFYAILSLFPGLLVLAAALGSLDSLLGADVAADAEAALIDFLNRTLTSGASSTTTAVRELFRGQHGGVLTFSAIAALYALTRGFGAAIRALDIAYDLEESRSWWRQRLTALALAGSSAVVAVVVLATFVAGPLLGGGQSVADAIGAGGVFAVFWDWFRWPLALAVLVAWATTLYHVGPNHHTPWRADIPGGIFAALGWVLASLGFSLYIGVAGGSNQVFGLLGGGLILLLWLYLMSVIMLFGGELNATLLQFQHDEQPA